MAGRYSAVSLEVRVSDCNFSLYVSEDYGKTFDDVTHLINHTFIQTAFGIAISPDHSGKVRLGVKSNAFFLLLVKDLYSCS